MQQKSFTRMVVSVLVVLMVFVFAPLQFNAGIPAAQAAGATYYLSPTGSDSNSGTSASSPWLTPNHSLNCGDTIVAAPSTAYASSNFNYDWGTVTCAAGNNVAWLKCATFDACKINVSVGGLSNHGMSINNSYWGVQGWEVTVTNGGACFNSYPTSHSIHHIIFADNICNGADNGSFDNSANLGSGYANDYWAAVGNIAYNSVQTASTCDSAFDIIQLIKSDSLPGSHIYVAGNFVYSHVEGNCNNGAPTDGEGVILDTLNQYNYDQQVAVQNNIFIANGGRAVQPYLSSLAPTYIKNNTTYQNNTQNGTSANCGEIQIALSSHVSVTNNLTEAPTNKPCGGNGPVSAYFVQNGDTTDSVSSNWGYSSLGANTGSINSSGFSFGANTFANPLFSNPVLPPAPSCAGYASVPACMATVVANFTPTNAAAKAYGYQKPGASISDPLFPQWLCNVNLPSGLVTMGCGGSSDTTPPSTPTNLSGVAASTSQISLAWTSSTDNVAVTGYKVFRNGTQVGTAAGASYSDTGLNASTNYSYTVSAYDAAGNNSAQSGSASVTTKSVAVSTPCTGTPAPVPGIIQAENFDKGGEGVAYHDADVVNTGGAYRTTEGVDLEATGDTGAGYDIGWTNPGEWMNYTVSVQSAGTYTLSTRVASNGQGGTFHYQIDGANIGGEITIPTTGAWQTYTTLTETVTLPAGTHILKLVEDTAGASGGVGNFNWIQLTAIAPPDTTPPSVPTGFFATPVSTSQINLAWMASTDNVGVTGYRIYRGGTLIATTPSNSYQNTGLTASTSYSYTVSAYDAAGNSSAQSTSASATTQANTVVIPFRINVGASGTYTDGSGNFWSADQFGSGGATFTNTATVTGTTAPTVYQTERYGVGTSSFAYNIPVANGTYNVNPDFAETTGSPVTGAGQRIFNISVNGTQVLTNFDIYATSGGMNIAVVKTVSATVTNGTLNITFTPASGSAQSPKVNGIEIVVPPVQDTTPPSVPANLSATSASTSQINLSWTASTDNVGVTGYKVFRNGAQVGTTAGTSYSDTGLYPSVVYSYTVSAYDAAGNNSAQSSAAAAITSAPSTPAITVGARVVTTAKINVRQSASLSATKLGTESLGSPGTVVGGPQSASGYTWWQINYDNAVSGWSIGNYLSISIQATSSPALGFNTSAPAALGTASPSSVADANAGVRSQLALLEAELAHLEALIVGR